MPMVLHSHGWGGSRTTDPASFAYLTDAGFGVLSFDQRGFGESGGQAYIENPDVEGKDVQKVVDLVAAQPWVKKQKPGDPVLGAIGGSYGGGYQFVGAFSELRDTGATRFDALVPEITWWSLTESLFPQGVPRTEWATALTAAALPTNALPPIVLRGFAEATATGACRRTSTTSSTGTVRSGTCATGASSTSPCSSARARPTTCSRSTRG